MFCAISGSVPEHPVASAKTGHVFEKALVEKYIESTGKCPVTGEPLAASDLLALKSSAAVKPRPPSASSIPAMLSLLHSEWDSLMLESFTLKRQLDVARQELAHSLYQHDASCRVIARLSAERDEARRALETVGATAGHARGAAEDEPAAKRQAVAAAGPAAAPSAAAAGAAAPVAPGSALPDGVLELFDATFKRLSKGRKKRAPPAGCATAAELSGAAACGPALKPAGMSKATIGAADVLPAAPAESGWAASLVLGGSDGSMRLCDAASGALVRPFATKANGGHAAGVVALVCGAEAVLSADAKGVVKIWSLAGQAEGKNAVTCAHSLEPHGASPCTALALHATERYGVTAAGDGSFALLDLAAGAVVARGQCPAGEAISAAALHPDGLILATGVDSGAIRLWDLKSMSNAATFEGKADAGALAQPIRALAFSENGYQLASAAEDGTVKLWDLRKLAQVATIAAHESVGAVASLRFDESAQFLAVGGAAGVAAYSSKSWDLLCAHATASAVSTVRFAPNARALLALTGKEIVACAPGAA